MQLYSPLSQTVDVYDETTTTTAAIAIFMFSLHFFFISLLDSNIACLGGPVYLITNDNEDDRKQQRVGVINPKRISVG